jgi:hypothetical protein
LRRGKEQENEDPREEREGKEPEIPPSEDLNKNKKNTRDICPREDEKVENCTLIEI